KIPVPVAFTPSDPGSAAGTLTVATDKGDYTFTLTGSGQAQEAVLTASPPIVSFGGVVVGDSNASVVTFGNGGGQPLTITGVTLPGAPFSVPNAPAANDTIAPGEVVNVTVHYDPTAVGDFNDDLILDTTAGQKIVGLSGSAGLGPKLTLAPTGGWDFGSVTIGETKTVALTMSNSGDSPMTITRSKPPTNARFTVLDALDEATVIPAGESRTLRISFTPTEAGTITDAWSINAGDGSGARAIAVTGTGAKPTPVEPDPVDPTPVPPVTPVPIVADPMPPLVAPEIAQSRPALIVQKLRPDLSVTKAQLSRDGRKVIVRGRVSAAAIGRLSLKLSARVGRRTVTKTSSLRLRGRSTYTITMVLPKAARS
ncbi:MAG: choice-of-anchor D domain-containing protein, partial [Solirubrobacterales bacterium]